MKKKSKHYYAKQKLLGFALVVLGVLSAIILDGDITVALLIVPLGSYVMLTKDAVLTESEKFDENEES